MSLNNELLNLEVTPEIEAILTKLREEQVQKEQDIILMDRAIRDAQRYMKHLNANKDQITKVVRWPRDLKEDIRRLDDKTSKMNKLLKEISPVQFKLDRLEMSYEKMGLPVNSIWNEINRISSMLDILNPILDATTKEKNGWCDRFDNWKKSPDYRKVTQVQRNRYWDVYLTRLATLKEEINELWNWKKPLCARSKYLWSLIRPWLNLKDQVNPLWEKYRILSERVDDITQAHWAKHNRSLWREFNLLKETNFSPYYGSSDPEDIDNQVSLYTRNPMNEMRKDFYPRVSQYSKGFWSSEKEQEIKSGSSLMQEAVSTTQVPW